MSMDPVEIDHGVIYRDDEGQYRWRTVGGNGEKLGSGEGYADKRDAIAALMAHTGDDVDIIEQIGDTE